MPTVDDPIPTPDAENVIIDYKQTGEYQFRYSGRCAPGTTDDDLHRKLAGTGGGHVERLYGGEFTYVSYCD
jgi:hypothetical protein